MTLRLTSIRALAIMIALACLSTVVVPSSAQAWHRGFAYGAGPFLGGLAVGAIIGNAFSAPNHYPYYYAPAPIYAYPACYWTRQWVWDGYGYVLRRVRVCQ